MLIRVLVSSFLFVFLVALAGCGPKNFDDCVLKNMKGVKDKFAAMAVTTTCRNKFPFPVEEKKIHIEVPSEVIDKIRGEIERIPIESISRVNFITLLRNGLLLV